MKRRDLPLGTGSHLDSKKNRVNSIGEWHEIQVRIWSHPLAEERARKFDAEEFSIFAPLLLSLPYGKRVHRGSLAVSRGILRIRIRWRCLICIYRAYWSIRGEGIGWFEAFLILLRSLGYLRSNYIFLTLKSIFSLNIKYEGGFIDVHDLTFQFYVKYIHKTLHTPFDRKMRTRLKYRNSWIFAG